MYLIAIGGPVESQTVTSAREGAGDPLSGRRCRNATQHLLIGVHPYHLTTE